MADSIFDIGSYISTENASDFLSDRLNHVWAVLCLICFAVIVSLQQYVGDPIHCWCPAEFTDSHCNYTEAYCWVEDTYFIPQDEIVPWEKSERYHEEIKYYQWVPLILLFLATCFKMPHIFWSMMNGFTGVNIQQTIVAAEESIFRKDDDKDSKDNKDTGSVETTQDDSPSKNTDYIAEYLDRWLTMTQGKGKKRFEFLTFCNCFPLSPGTGNSSYITYLYIFTKVIYLSISIGLIFALQAMLAKDYGLYGWEVITDLYGGEELEESPMFPRVTMCDLRIRQLQNILSYSVQCVLSVNLFNEKIFILIWFLLAFLTICNVIALISSIKNLCVPSVRRQWIKRKMGDNDGKRKYGKVDKFVQYLGSDGAFILRLMEDKTSGIIVYDVINKLFELYHNRVSS